MSSATAINTPAVKVLRKFLDHIRQGGKAQRSNDVLDLSRIPLHELRRLRIGGLQNIRPAPSADDDGVTP